MNPYPNLPNIFNVTYKLGETIMQLEDYFTFLSEDDIRINGHRIGIDNV